MVFPDGEFTIARHDSKGARAREPRPHAVAGFWVAGMLVALLGAVVVAGLWVFGTPPQPCRLPRAPVPETPGQIGWSPDGTQLLAACPNGMYLVELPGQTVSRIPQPQKETSMTWFDFRNRPLALVAATSGPALSVFSIPRNRATTPRQSSGLSLQRAYQLLRWDEMTKSWRPLPVAGHQVSLSPCGRYAAALRFEPSPASRKVAAGEYPLPPLPVGRVMVTDLQTGKQLRSFLLRQPGLPSLQWEDSRTLSLLWGMPVIGDMTYHLGDAGPQAGPRGGLKQPAGPIAWTWETHSGVTEALDKLREWKVPGVPAEDPVDLTLAIGPAGKGADREFGLGRVHSRTPYGTYRPAPQLSPDGRYVAAAAGDGTLRLFDLKKSTPGSGAQ